MEGASERQPAGADVRPDDPLLVARARAGDLGAFAVLVDRHAVGLAAFCRRLTGGLGGSAGADDLFQETILRAFQSLDRLEQRDRFGAWLFGIAANLARWWWRGAARVPVSLDSVAAAGRDLADPLRPDAALEAAERARHLLEAIRSLPAPLRHVLILHYVEGLSYADVAAALTLPVSTIKGRLFKSRARLRRDLPADMVPAPHARRPARSGRPPRGAGPRPAFPTATGEARMPLLPEIPGPTGLVRFARGKVRDVYAVGDDRLFIVSTDRVSAFDVVLPNPIPDRGKVLTQLSTFWFRQTGDIVPNHLIADDVASFPESVRAQRDVVDGRSMLVRRTKRVDVECVARGYLSGSAWSEYKQRGTACGIPLPAGLVENQPLAEPLFTPTTKAEHGHDLPLSFDQLVEQVGGPLAEQLRDVTLAVYAYAAKVARKEGIIIADTKLEFGQLDDELILIDELLTPDSSRFWDAAAYEPGKTPASFDKQYLRDWLETTSWNKESPPPELPPDVVANTRARYLEALERLTSKGL